MSVQVVDPGPLVLPHTSVEPIYAAERTGFPGQPDLDPTSFPVYVMLASDLTLIPTVGAAGWVAATWTSLGGAHFITLAYDGTKPAGLYNLWTKTVVTPGTNLPIRLSGQVQLI